MLDWVLCTLVKGLSVLLCCLPPSVAVWLGECLGLVAMWAQPRRAQIGMTNLRAAFNGQLSPAQARAIIRACFKQLGAGIMEMLRLPAMDQTYMDRYIIMEGLRRFEEAHAAGTPTIFLTGHFGNWELSSIAAALKGYPILVLARAQEHFPRLYKLLVSFRESKGCTGAQGRRDEAADRSTQPGPRGRYRRRSSHPARDRRRLVRTASALCDRAI